MRGRVGGAWEGIDKWLGGVERRGLGGWERVERGWEGAKEVGKPLPQCGPLQHA